VCDRCLEWLLQAYEKHNSFYNNLPELIVQTTVQVRLIPLQNIDLLYTYIVQRIRTAAAFPRHNFK